MQGGIGIETDRNLGYVDWFILKLFMTLRPWYTL